MFDKKKFKSLIEKAMGTRKISQFSSDSGVNRTYISKYINERLNSPPAPDVLKRLSDSAQNNVSYEELMSAAGYINSKKDNYKDVNLLEESKETYEITKKEETDILKDVEKIIHKLDKSESGVGVRFNGEEMDEETKEIFKSALDFAIKTANIKKKNNKKNINGK